MHKQQFNGNPSEASIWVILSLWVKPKNDEGRLLSGVASKAEVS